MATINGEVMMLTWNALHHPVSAHVTAIQDDVLLGDARVDEDYRFSFEIPDSVRGEVEVRLALVDAAPATVVADGGDLDVVVLYNPINNVYA